MSSTRTIAVTSGKGGVGKSNLALGIAALIARTGRRVTLVDLDLGLANIDILLGCRPKFTLQHLLEGVRTLDEVLVQGPYGLRILPSGSGVEALANLDAEGRSHLFQHLTDIERRSDVVVFDTAPGISDNVVSFVAAADAAAVIATPEATAMTDAYALIKVVHTRRPGIDLGLIVNMARSSAEGRKTLDRIRNVADRFLGAAVRPLGVLPYDDSVRHAAAQRRSFVEIMAESPAALCLAKAAAQVLETAASPPGADRSTYAARLAGYPLPA